MPLEQLVHSIQDIEFSSESIIANGKLSICRDEIQQLLGSDSIVQLVGIEIAKPGQSIRMAPVLDVVEPRTKDNPSETAFPGILGFSESCGTGKTHILKNTAVIGICDLQGVQEGLVDMSETAQSFCPFAKTLNFVLVFKPRNGVDRITADNTIRKLLLKVAEYLASLARHLKPDQIVTMEWPLPRHNHPFCGLVYLVQSQGDLRRTYFKGQALDNTKPMLLNPVEILDGAIVSGNFVMPSNKTSTYIHQNHPLIEALLRNHGKVLDFSGVILANEMSDMNDKKQAAKAVVQLAKELDLSGVVINQEGGANTLTDIMMLCHFLEKENIKTVLILNEFAGVDGTTPSLAETAAEARHIVSTGNNDHRITLPSVEKCLGIEVFPGVKGTLFDEITVPLARVHSSTNQLGFNRLSCTQNSKPLILENGIKDRPLRVVHYLNQFFGQIGGEDRAHAKLQVKPGPVGPGLAFEMVFGEEAEIVATIICGDNTMAENLEASGLAVADLAKAYSPDVFIAGPCFGSGRYGMACGAAAKAVTERLEIPTIVGISKDNPGADIYRAYTYMVPCGKSVVKTRQAVEAMVKVALSLADGKTPHAENYLSGKKRELVIRKKSGAVRAVDMLIARLSGKEAQTELPLPKFDRVSPAPPLVNLGNATIFLCTEGGLIPKDNPDQIEMSMATKFGTYTIAGLSAIDPIQFTVAHGGYDNTHVQDDPNRLLPLDVMRDLEHDGIIGKVADVIYTTAGNATSVENAVQFGREIASDIRKRHRQNVGVVFTST